MSETAARKRKRTANFAEDEKLKFLRLLQTHGQCIITKLTSHDASTNKDKEAAWIQIIKYLNASGSVIRTTETLKKLWQKMKSDAKTYKAKLKHSVTGTGGGPSRSFEDLVLELVVELTGRGSSGIVNVPDCDADHSTSMNTSTAADDSVADQTAANVSVQDIEYLDDSILQDEDNFSDDVIVTDKKIIKKENKEQGNWKKRRQPQLPNTDERSAAMKVKAKLCNSFAAERLKTEREKTDLMLLQKRQMIELHDCRMENERLKKVLLETLIKKISDGDQTEAKMFSTINDILD